MFREPSELPDWEREELAGTDLIDRANFNKTRRRKLVWIAFVVVLAVVSYVLWARWYVMLAILILIVPVDDVWKSYAQYERGWREANDDHDPGWLERAELDAANPLNDRSDGI